MRYCERQIGADDVLGSFILPTTRAAILPGVCYRSVESPGVTAASVESPGVTTANVELGAGRRFQNQLKVYLKLKVKSSQAYQVDTRSRPDEV